MRRTKANKDGSTSYGSHALGDDDDDGLDRSGGDDDDDAEDEDEENDRSRSRRRGSRQGTKRGRGKKGKRGKGGKGVQDELLPFQAIVISLKDSFFNKADGEWVGGAMGEVGVGGGRGVGVREMVWGEGRVWVDDEGVAREEGVGEWGGSRECVEGLGGIG